jgi:palmitoyltransferase
MAPAALSPQSGSGLSQGLERRKESIEERCFAGALICLEAQYGNMPTMGPLTNAKINSMISKTLEKTHNFKDVR